MHFSDQQVFFAFLGFFSSKLTVSMEPLGESKRTLNRTFFFYLAVAVQDFL